MSCLLATSPLNEECTWAGVLKGVSPDLLQKLKAESQASVPIADLSGTLFTQLRQVSKQPRLTEIMRAIMVLAGEGTPDGMRLLAAFLDVSTPGARLLPQIKDFNSCRRRRFVIINSSKKQGSYEKDWLLRLDLLGRRCDQILLNRNLAVSMDSSRPGNEAPWPKLRLCLHSLLMDIAGDKVLDQPTRDVLVGLLKLEIDSRQDRVSNLAGIVDPFNVSQVARLLPLLGAIDGDIRDLRQLVAWVAEGKDKIVFNKRLSRGLEIMDGVEFSRLLRADEKDDGISPLIGLLRYQEQAPLSLAELGAGMARLIAVTSLLVQDGIRGQTMNPLTAVAIIHKHRTGKEVWIPLEMGICADSQRLLCNPTKQANPQWWPLSGIRIVGDQMCLPLTDGEELLGLLGGRLPSMEDVNKLLKEGCQENDEESAVEGSSEQLSANKDNIPNKNDDSNGAVTKLVMQNIQSVSVLLGFLRNPKIAAIPGLVGKIATRTRNPRIIETIASDRTLYSGFANRDVPLACLTTPCNVPVKTLVKFIHVKYISKVDLRRMAKDKAGMRREVCVEIEKYLDSLD